MAQRLTSFGRITWAVALLCLLFFQSSQLVGQQRFRLTVGDNSKLSSTAVLNGDRITISDSLGGSYTYQRAAIADSKDGTYLGYFNATSMQYLRWPASGQGKMFIGSGRGISLTWRQSKMTVSSVGAKPKPTLTPKPSVGTFKPSSTTPTKGGSKADFSVLEHTDGTMTVASVDDQGKLLMYRGKDDNWTPIKSPISGKLPANAPVTLLPGTGKQPVVVGVTKTGAVFRIANGSAKVLGGAVSPLFATGTKIARAGNTGNCYACDEDGCIWAIDVNKSSFVAVEKRKNLFQPGASIAAFSSELVVIDKIGNMVGYTNSLGAWGKPYLIESGFVSGSKIDSWSKQGAVASQMAVASVDKKGQPVVLVSNGNQKWHREVVTGLKLNPGAPIGIDKTNGSYQVTAVDSDGKWNSYQRTNTGAVATWTPVPVAGGFGIGGPVGFGPGGHAFAFNRAGQLVAASFRNGRWITGRRFAPIFREREVVPNPPLKPVEIVLNNDHKETLVVRVFDKRDRTQSELRLRPGASAKIKIDRDSGATMRDSVSVVGPFGGGVGDTRVRQVPPKPLYDIVVYEHKVTSVFFDRTKNKTKTPDQESKSLVSVGVFTIPPGDKMTNGSQLRVFGSAKRQKNPGAAALYGPIK